MKEAPSLTAARTSMNLRTYRTAGKIVSFESDFGTRRLKRCNT